MISILQISGLCGSVPGSPKKKRPQIWASQFAPCATGKPEHLGSPTPRFDCCASSLAKNCPHLAGIAGHCAKACWCRPTVTAMKRGNWNTFSGFLRRRGCGSPSVNACNRSRGAVCRQAPQNSSTSPRFTTVVQPPHRERPQKSLTSLLRLPSLSLQLTPLLRCLPTPSPWQARLYGLPELLSTAFLSSFPKHCRRIFIASLFFPMQAGFMVTQGASGDLPAKSSRETVWGA